ncbi:MAG: rhodanese-like domain-containing protein [Candidatus Omnitrophota bacterium]
MIKVLIVACLGILLFASDGRSEQEIAVNKACKIDIKPESWDFGKITEPKVISREFEVKNTGNDVLTIKNITTSCGCTTVSISSKDISPGRSATLNLKIDTRQINSSGKSTRHVYVESNDPQEPTKAISVTLELEAAKESKPLPYGEVKVSHKAKIVSVPKISSRKLYSLIKKSKRITILDVREENEYVGKHIPEAIWFPKSKFDKQDPSLLKKLEDIDRKAMVIAYCGAGHRSNYVAKKLRAMGYNVYNLDGISFWEKENLPLIRGPKLPPSEEPSIIRLEEAYENYYLLFKDIVWIDVRDIEDYKRGHVKGALGIPLPEIESRLNEIHKDREIVFYCEGTWDGGSCEASRSAGRILIKNGYKQGNIKVFEDGYGAWKNAGYPISKL